jgi:hypothetical protein
LHVGKHIFNRSDGDVMHGTSRQRWLRLWLAAMTVIGCRQGLGISREIRPFRAMTVEKLDDAGQPFLFLPLCAAT